jgi:hypothetical protein
MDKNELKKLVKEELDKMLEAPEVKAPSDVVALQRAEKTSAIASKQKKINTPEEAYRAIIITINKYMKQLSRGGQARVKSKIITALKNIK